MATQRATSDCISKLQERLDEMYRSKGDHTKFIKADQAFHSAIAEISGNPILFAVSQAMFEWLAESHKDTLLNLLGVPELEDLTLQ